MSHKIIKYYIVIGGQEKTIKIWKIDNNNSIRHKSIIWCINEIKGNKVISGSSDNTALIWDINNNKLDFELFKYKEISVELQLKADIILLCSSDDLILFDLNSKKNNKFTNKCWSLDY